MKTAGRDRPGRIIKIGLVLLIFLLPFLISQILYQNTFKAKTGGFDSLPVSLKAGSMADYGQDPDGQSVPPISEKIIDQMITEFPATGSPQERISTLQANLSTAVPTMTAVGSQPTTVNPGLPTPTFTFPTATLNIPPTPTAVASVILPTFTSTPLPIPATVTPTLQPAPTNTVPAPKPTKPPKPPKPTKPPKPF